MSVVLDQPSTGSASSAFAHVSSVLTPSRGIPAITPGVDPRQLDLLERDISIALSPLNYSGVNAWGEALTAALCPLAGSVAGWPTRAHSGWTAPRSRGTNRGSGRASKRPALVRALSAPTAVSADVQREAGAEVHAFPTTWWLEASRRGLLGHGAPGAMAQLSDGTVLLFLLVSTVVIIPIALAAFALFIRRARQLGLLDMLTGT